MDPPDAHRRPRTTNSANRRAHRARTRPPKSAARQLEMAITWGRRAELLDYAADQQTIRLDHAHPESLSQLYRTRTGQIGQAKS